MIYGIINTNYTTDSQKTKLVEFGVSSIIFLPGTGNELSRLSNLKDGDKVFTTQILNLDLPYSSASNTYQTIFNTGADLIILDSPTLSSEIYKKTLILRTKGLTAKESERVIAAVTDILNLQIEAELKKNIPIRNEEVQEDKKEKKPVRKNTDRKIVITKKEVDSKKFIRENLIDFGGMMTNNEIMAALHLARNSYYKYKKKVSEEIRTENRLNENAENFR